MRLAGRLLQHQVLLFSFRYEIDLETWHAELRIRM